MYALKKFVKLHNSEKDIFLQQPIFVKSDKKNSQYRIEFYPDYKYFTSFILDDQGVTTETPVPEENLSKNLESVRHYSFRFLDEEIPIENIQEPEQIAQHLGKYILTNIIISTMGLSINDVTHFTIQ